MLDGDCWMEVAFIGKWLIGSHDTAEPAQELMFLTEALDFHLVWGFILILIDLFDTASFLAMLDTQTV